MTTIRCGVCGKESEVEKNSQGFYECPHCAPKKICRCGEVMWRCEKGYGCVEMPDDNGPPDDDEGCSPSRNAGEGD